MLLAVVVASSDVLASFLAYIHRVSFFSALITHRELVLAVSHASCLLNWLAA